MVDIHRARERLSRTPFPEASALGRDPCPLLHQYRALSRPQEVAARRGPLNADRARRGASGTGPAGGTFLPEGSPRLPVVGAVSQGIRELLLEPQAFG